MTERGSEVLVEQIRTGAQGVVRSTRGRGGAATCTVEFEHGTEEVPKALLRPLWDPFELLAEPQVVYPYDAWLRRERFKLLDAYRNDMALGLSSARVEPQLHQ